MSLATQAQFLAMIMIPAGLAMAAMILVGWKGFTHRGHIAQTSLDTVEAPAPEPSRLPEVARWVLLAPAVIVAGAALLGGRGVGGLVSLTLIGLCLAGCVATFGRPRIAAAALALSAIAQVAVLFIAGPMISPSTQNDSENLMMGGGFWLIAVVIGFVIPAMISAVLLALDSVRQPSKDQQLVGADH